MRRTFGPFAAAIAILAGALLLVPALVYAAGRGATDTPLFSISKTENRNYVQFAERLDATCAPIGGAPIHAFWQMREHGPSAVESLLPHEQPAYGIASQSVIAASEGHGLVRVTLRALPHDPLVVESTRAPDGSCQASARTSIGGVGARLFNVHAVLRWPFGIARLLVSGWSLADGSAVRESRAP